MATPHLVLSLGKVAKRLGKSLDRIGLSLQDKEGYVEKREYAPPALMRGFTDMHAALLLTHTSHLVAALLSPPSSPSRSRSIDARHAARVGAPRCRRRCLRRIVGVRHWQGADGRLLLRVVRGDNQR